MKYEKLSEEEGVSRGRVGVGRCGLIGARDGGKVS